MYEDALYEEQAYASLENETEKPQQNIVKELHSTNRTKTKNYVVDLCEQMVTASEDFEETKEEYRVVTNQLSDVQIIEDMSEEEMAPLVECAKHITELGDQRQGLLKEKRRISDEQFDMMQAEEDALPGIIRRLKSNEKHLDAVKKDMAFLEGKKLEWAMQKNEAKHLQTVMRSVVLIMLALCVTLIVLFFVLTKYTNVDIELAITIIGFVVAVSVTYIFVRYQDSVRDIKQADVNRNRAITLENSAKIKYVNSKNAVDFTCEKYDVRNSKELETLYERYQAEVKKRRNFQQTNEDLDYYSRTLLSYLSKLRMFDARSWLVHANAIVDNKELVELKHKLITQRQRLRDRMESTLNSLSQMKQEAMKNIDSFGEERQKVEEIIRKIETLTPNL
jgi:hypothetical protein